MHTPKRKSIRLKDYDYAQDGAYAITICTHKRQCIFGNIVEEEMELNTLGCIVDSEWRKTEQIRKYIILDHYVIMPNHLHGILVINHPVAQATQDFRSRKFGGSLPRTIASMIGQFKSKTTKLIRKTLATPQFSVWQDNYYEQVLRNEKHLNDTRLYIEQNPVKWAFDEENPERD
jgi:putative transposase